MGNNDDLATQLDRVRDRIREVRPILAARRAELAPLLVALGQFDFKEFRPALTEMTVANQRLKLTGGA